MTDLVKFQLCATYVNLSTPSPLYEIFGPVRDSIEEAMLDAVSLPDRCNIDLEGKAWDHHSPGIKIIVYRRGQLKREATTLVDAIRSMDLATLVARLPARGD